jgi:transcriptional regulator with XRE-family HTH domain
MELALEARMSARHLSFVETGRSRPGRDVVVRLLEALSVPPREQNELLLRAGYAPEFPERSLDHPDLEPVRNALDLVLRRHEPYPAIAVDRHWNLVASNRAIEAIATTVAVDPQLLDPPINAIRVGLHPRGLAPLLVNPGEWRAHFRERLRRQAAQTADRDLVDLADEIDTYVYPEPEDDSVLDVLGPLKVRGEGGRALAFLGMFATFDHPFEINTSELAVELLFPADQATAEAFERAGARKPERP